MLSRCLKRLRLNQIHWHCTMQGPKEIGDIETDDEKDEEEQYEQWKSREMRRIRWVITHPYLLAITPGHGCLLALPMSKSQEQMRMVTLSRHSNKWLLGVLQSSRARGVCWQ